MKLKNVQTFDDFITESYLNEDTWYDYEKDGIYKVGQYGSALYGDLKSLINAFDDEEGDIAPYDAPENSLIRVIELNDKKYDKLIDTIYQVEIIKVGNKPSPYDSIQVDKGKTYYGSNHSIFGSGNVKFIKEDYSNEKKIKDILTESIKGYKSINKEIPYNKSSDDSKKLYDILFNENDISNILIGDRPNWGEVVVFTYDNKKYFSQIGDDENKLIDIFNDTKDYSATPVKTIDFDFIDGWKPTKIYRP